MKLRHCLIAFLFLLPTMASADNYFFGGGGLGYMQTNLSLDSTKSEFRGSSYYLTGGTVMGGGNNGGFGLLLKGEAGRGQSINLIKSTSYMESVNTTFVAGKLALLIGNLGFGGGNRLNQIRIKSLSNTTGMVVSDQSGNTPVAFINYTLPNPKLVRSEVELQYVTGKVGPIDYNELSINLSLSFTDSNN